MKAWKVRKFFGDVVYDLRSRCLLPAVILFVVPIVAVPMLISRGRSQPSHASLLPTSAATEVAPEAERAVVAYQPGVRDYKKRLDDDSANNPFKLPVTKSSAAADSQLDSTVTPSSGSGSAPTGTGTGTATPTGSTGTVTRHTFLFHSVADLSFGDASQPLVRHKKIKPYTMLPNDTAPVVVYLGSTLDEKRSLFSISKFTEQLTGDGRCAPGPGDCSLLSLGPGQSEEMVYADGKTYRLKINKINRVIIKNPAGG